MKDLTKEELAKEILKTKQEHQLKHIIYINIERSE